MAVKFKDTININDQYVLPLLDGTDGQVLTTDGSGNLSFAEIDLNGALINPVDFIQFSGGTGDQGTVSWNTDEETLDLIQNGTTLQLGQEIHVHVRNSTGSTIPNATPVYVTGTLGASGRLTVGPMIADGSIPAKYFLGVTTEAILDGEDGKVTYFGKVRDVDTTVYGEGQTLFVSSTVAGAFQTTAPISPALDLEVAITVNDKSNGTLFVRANNGYYLGMLHDVYMNNESDKDLLVYNTTAGRWENSKTVGDLLAGALTATSFIKTGGTSSEFLKADGSVDSTNYQEQLTAGTGISLAGDTVTNTAPDQTVVLTGSGAATVTGTYPSFNVDVEESAGAGTTTIQKNSFTGDGTTVAFTLQSAITSGTLTQVYIDGVYQSKDNYTTSGSAVTFSTAPDNGTDIEIIHLVTVSAVVDRETFTGDGSETQYTLYQEVSSENNTQIYIDGVYQSKDNYMTSGQVITFSTAPDDGVEIEVVHIKSVDPSTLNSNQLTGDGTTTDFTLSQSVDSKDKSFVFIQGVYQEKSTYTLGGTTISFSTPPQDGYTIEVMTFSTISISGALTARSVDVITSNTTAISNSVYVLDADVTLTLPASPEDGDSIKISNFSGDVNCVIARNGSNIMGIAEDLNLNNANFNFELIYTGAAKGWVII